MTALDSSWVGKTSGPTSVSVTTVVVPAWTSTLRPATALNFTHRNNSLDGDVSVVRMVKIHVKRRPWARPWLASEAKR